MKEPLLWFLVVGALLFGADNYLSTDNEQIVVDAAVKNRLNKLWQTQTGKEATQAELDALIQRWIKEEVFYREAIALNLDRDDSIVRRRLVQKLTFLIDDTDVEALEENELENFYQKNVGAYSLPTRYSFSQIFFSKAEVAEDIRRRLEAGDNWRSLGEPSMLDDSYVSRSQKELASGFGAAFIPQLNTLVEGEWVGPVKSSFGFHLVRLENIQASEATPLQHIKQRVLADYQQQQVALQSDIYFEKLLEKYQLVLE